MESKKSEFQNTRRFSFLWEMILEHWIKQLLSNEQISEVRQSFHNLKKFHAVCWHDIRILKRALVQIVGA